MAFGNIGKVLADQAIEATKKNVLGAITGPEPKAADKPQAPPVETVGGTILGQLQAMQRPLRDDQELVVTFHTGSETLRVTEIFVPTLQVFVLAGPDGRVITPSDKAQLVCKIVAVRHDAKPVRVNVLSPRPKPAE